MNTPEGFDDLVRRKLEERVFPFDEAHWLEAQRAIQAEQRHKRSNGWWFTGPLVLLISLGTWWVMNTADRVATNHANTSAPALVRSAVPASVAPSRVKPLADAVSLPSTLPSTHAAHPERTPLAEAVAKTPKAIRAVEPSTSPVPAIDQQAPAQNTSAVAIASPKSARSLANHADVAADGVSVARNDAAPISTKEPMSSGTIDALDSTTRNSGSVPPISTGGDVKGSQQETVLATTLAPEPIAPEPSVIPPTNSGTDNLASTAALSSTPDSSIFNADSTSTEDLATPTPPLIDRISPWEISAMAGLLSTASRYKGGGSDTWSKGVSNGAAPTFGAELMHMGKHFGIGTGAHYSTFSERIRTEERTSTLIDIQNYWYLQPVVIDVLVITGSFDSLGVTYYVGENQQTEVNVLANGSDTTVTTTVLRSGRDQVNRTSYLEVPLLLDAHLTQGRWILGLRGGPMFGVLTRRQGAVPNAADDGYAEFTDQAFRSLILGYTARAYIRYRFNSAWAIGVEPTIKGHLMDTYANGDLSRRTSGFGGVLSLTYRLR